MRLLFIGSVKFSLSVLKKLVDINADVVGVVSTEKGLWNSDYIDLKPFCELNSIPFFHTDNINSQKNINLIKNFDVDLIFCIGWSQILSKGILDIPKFGSVGYHPTKLPKNRGRHPLIWTLALGLKTSASTFFKLKEGVDNGNIISQKPFSIDYSDDANSLYEKITKLALLQIEDFFPKLINNQIALVPQKDNDSNFWRERFYEDGLIKFSKDSYVLYNLIRALTKPYIGAHINYKGNDVKVWKAKELKLHSKEIEPGTVVDIQENQITVQCKKKSIILINHEFKKLPKIGELLG